MFKDRCGVGQPHWGAAEKPRVGQGWLTAGALPQPGKDMFDSCIDSLFSVVVEMPLGGIGHHQETFLMVTLRGMSWHPVDGGQEGCSASVVYRTPQ